MPTELARWYDVMDELENFDYAYMTGRELQENQDMYYELAEQEFPQFFD